MGNKYLNLLTQVVRHPRHLASGEPILQCRVRRRDGLLCGESLPQLLDFSRGGCCLRWSVQLEKFESIVVQLCDDLNGLSLDLPATVRWVRCDDGDYTAGCQFTEEVDYELLGELFLSGFLSMEEAPFR
jgi:hypothetical protein